MRDINRIEPMMAEFTEFWKAHPDWRFGQLIMNFISWYYQKYKKDCFYIEDNEILKYIEEFIDEVRGV